MFGWLSLASARASRVKRSAKPGIVAGPGRQDLQRDKAVEPRLAGLIDRAHAALADELQNLELGKELGHGLHRQAARSWDPPPPSVPEAVPKPAFIRHSGQMPLRRIRRQRLPATWTCSHRIHNFLSTCF